MLLSCCNRDFFWRNLFSARAESLKFEDVAGITAPDNRFAESRDENVWKEYCLQLGGSYIDTDLITISDFHEMEPSGCTAQQCWRGSFGNVTFRDGLIILRQGGIKAVVKTEEIVKIEVSKDTTLYGVIYTAGDKNIFFTGDAAYLVSDKFIESIRGVQSPLELTSEINDDDGLAVVCACCGKMATPSVYIARGRFWGHEKCLGLLEKAAPYYVRAASSFFRISPTDKKCQDCCC